MKHWFSNRKSVLTDYYLTVEYLGLNRFHPSFIISVPRVALTCFADGAEHHLFILCLTSFLLQLRLVPTHNDPVLFPLSRLSHVHWYSSSLLKWTNKEKHQTHSDWQRRTCSSNYFTSLTLASRYTFHSCFGLWASDWTSWFTDPSFLNLWTSPSGQDLSVETQTNGGQDVPLQGGWLQSAW